jgi:hypothetical protein
MWKGLKKALGKPGKSKKCGSSLDRFGHDVSTRSTSSAAPSSVLFPLDLADADALAAWSEQNVDHEQQLPSLGRRAGTAAAGPDPLTAAQIQQQLQQQLVVQQLVQRTDDHSAGKRQAAALQKRIDNQMLNPSTCLYQISSLLSLSTLFEHKVSLAAAVMFRLGTHNVGSIVSKLIACKQSSSNAAVVCCLFLRDILTCIYVCLHWQLCACIGSCVPALAAVRRCESW